MISLIGFIFILVALISSLIIIFSEIFKKLSFKYFQFFIFTLTLFTILSFFSLIIAYIISDFSNFNVFENSHSNKPLLYKIAGSWGNHEGSMLLWISIMTLYGFVFSLEKNISIEFKRLALFFQTFLFTIFCCFIIFTSNPFLVNAIDVKEGLGLNPILQDPALAIHPPMLYAGYVGYSIVFSFAIAGIIQKKIDKNWIILTRKWSLLSWTFLTAGIALGSYWAYYELGWGGWWFWDPVENISLMPWITGLALTHSLLMYKGGYLLQKWIVFLSILCFSLSVFGTFLVRSGILTSVHSFASDSSRGLFLLIIFFLITGFGFTVFLIKTPKKNKSLQILFINKVSALIINNVLMIIATLTIFLGTIYPIIIEVITDNRISVGGPYFNSTVLPIMLPGFLLMSVAPTLSWQDNKIKKFRYYVLFFVFLSLLLLTHSLLTSFNTWGFLGLLLGSWIIIASLIAIILNFKFYFRFNYLKNINAYIAHIGVGIAIIGITSSSIFQSESNLVLKNGEEFKFGRNIVKLEEIMLNEKNNFQSLTALFSIKKDKKKIGEIIAGKNYYPVSDMITTEAGIFHDWFRDIYIILGSQEDDKWFIKIYNNPLVSFIWLGVMIMVFSGIIGVIKK
tara:strand:+ start:399 stop:2264 length:1866 start_codon:yes stop_codon:yes gene_type:complete